MYQKTHRRLTLFFAGITSLILVIMSAGYQYLSEREAKNNSFPSFTSEMNTLLSNLESQDTITYEWLSKIRSGGKYIIALYDNGVPLSYTTTALTTGELALIGEVLEENQEIIQELTSSAYYTSSHREFRYQSRDNQDYYVCYSNINRSSGTLSTVILFSTAEQTMQFQRQRLLLLGMNLLGVSVLFLFSYYYTGRLLRPIQKSQDQQSAFIAAASHELRTPVSVILSCVSALRCASPQEQESFLTTLETESTRMSHLITDMLTLVRSDNHAWSFHMEDVEPDTLLMNVYEAYRPLAGKKQIQLTIGLPDETFPPCRCDGERMTQLLEILLSNAISYGKQGGYVHLTLTHRHHEFCFQVIDDGIGISPAAKEHIFERFYREDGSRSGKGHFGLGLSIAEEIITAHHGSILVTDTPGGGTTFTVIVPQS